MRRALGEDNLVELYMQLRQGTMLGGHAAASAAAATTEPRTLAAHCAECVALLSGAMQSLERRRAAGTLLEGKCAAAEEAWRAKELQRDYADFTAADAASWAALFGYEEFLRAAMVALDVLSRARLFAAECSDVLLRSFAQHILYAAELMQQPRRHGDVAIDVEADFAALLRFAVVDAGVDGVGASLVQLLAGAWQRLQRSGVLQARRIEEQMRLRASVHTAADAVLQKNLTAPGLRTCALDGCGAREAHPAHFKSCAACRTVAYCSKEHQVEGWPSHKKACKAARKAAAAAAEEDDGAGPSGT